MKAGGFDAVIGNPPYVDIKGMPGIDVDYIFGHYAAANNRINLFAAFIERSLKIANHAGFRFGMIVPTAVLAQTSYQALRKLILSNFRIASLVRLPNESFGAKAGDVKVDTVIVVVGDEDSTDEATTVLAYRGYERVSVIEPSDATVAYAINQDTWRRNTESGWSIGTADRDVAILEKCERDTVPLDECVEFCLGLTPYDKYKGHTRQQIEMRAFHADHKKDDTFKPLLGGSDVRRYEVAWDEKEWISYGPWLGAAREQRFFLQRRILVKQIIDWTSKRIWASVEDKELYNTQNAFNLLARPNWSLNYLLGILNSRLMSYLHRKRYLEEFQMRFQKILIKDCRRLPIRTIDFSNKSDKSKHDKMVALVERMLDLHKRLAAAKAPADKERLPREIEQTDRQIDQLVYELYGLTEDEIKIVEEATK